MKDITIEVVFATKELQHVISINVTKDCSVYQAIHQSNIQQYFPNFSLTNNPEIAYGIFGKKIQNIETVRFKHLDRLEIYRKLQSSPNQKRLIRKQKSS
jgi:putative ubiquitin-RnfH superfamily antitoxin RatB of RatAB toxin-antitoxin module